MTYLSILSIGFISKFTTNYSIDVYFRTSFADGGNHHRLHGRRALIGWASGTGFPVISSTGRFQQSVGLDVSEPHPAITDEQIIHRANLHIVAIRSFIFLSCSKMA